MDSYKLFGKVETEKLDKTLNTTLVYYSIMIQIKGRYLTMIAHYLIQPDMCHNMIFLETYRTMRLSTESHWEKKEESKI